MSKATDRATGVIVGGLLCIVLKLIGGHYYTPFANVSWWWVCLPFWLPVAVMLAAFLMGLWLSVLVKVLEWLD